MTRNLRRIGWTELIGFELDNEEIPASLYSTLSEIFTEYYIYASPGRRRFRRPEASTLPGGVSAHVTRGEKESRREHSRNYYFMMLSIRKLCSSHDTTKVRENSMLDRFCQLILEEKNMFTPMLTGVYPLKFEETQYCRTSVIRLALFVPWERFLTRNGYKVPEVEKALANITGVNPSHQRGLAGSNY
ncbi:hypothetical protein F4805DRAFT_95330 [Annulohypoxylon moriforme]|nr:hypothetical protein F4805DRAFT_95330 [Annulohypoxylon moriforme]